MSLVLHRYSCQNSLVVDFSDQTKWFNKHSTVTGGKSSKDAQPLSIKPIILCQMVAM